jgi:hypothetical protein
MKTPPAEVVTRIQAHTIRAFFVPALVKKTTTHLEKRRTSSQATAMGTTAHALEPMARTAGSRARRRS